jgi:hypothetical protein
MNVYCLLFGGKREGERRDDCVFALILTAFFCLCMNQACFPGPGRQAFLCLIFQREFAKYK